jgi:hypothetical protein
LTTKLNLQKHITLSISRNNIVRREYIDELQLSFQ